MAGVDIPQVLFKGSGMAYISLISGEVSAAFSTVLSAHTAHQVGKIRALGVTTAKRVQIVPDVPTIAESGLPGFETSQWFGILGPARHAAAHRRSAVSGHYAQRDERGLEREAGERRGWKSSTARPRSSPRSFAARPCSGPK